MLIALGAVIAGFSLSKHMLISYGMLCARRRIDDGGLRHCQSLVQIIVTNEMRGRVMSVYNVAFRGGMPFGNLATGFSSVNQHLIIGVAVVHGATGSRHQRRTVVSLALYFF